jgi:hypothetical protein
MDFWHVHGWLFLIGATFFPRLTMLFAVSAPFGLLAWLGWLFVPHVTVAVLATVYYWHTNPVLCAVAWFVAIFGTAGEGKIASKGSKRKTR